MQTGEICGIIIKKKIKGNANHVKGNQNEGHCRQAWDKHCRGIKGFKRQAGGQRKAADKGQAHRRGNGLSLRPRRKAQDRTEQHHCRACG